MLRLLELLRGRRQREAAKREETYAELVERLASEPDDGGDLSDREAQRIDMALQLAGKTPDDLQRDVEEAREVSRHELTIADAEAARETLKAIDAEERELLAEHAERLRKFEASCQTLALRRSAANHRTSAVALAESRLAEIRRGKPSETTKAERLRSLGERRARIANEIARLPQIPSAAEVAEAKREADELAQQVDRNCSPLDARAVAFRESRDKLDDLERIATHRPRAERLARQLAAIDAEIASVKGADDQAVTA